MGFVVKAKHAVYDPVKIPACRQENRPSGRVYVTPNGDEYPSVTRFLGESADDKEWLEEWEGRVGQEEARRITEEAACVGNHYHDLNEAWITSQEIERRSGGEFQEAMALHKMTLPKLGRYSRFLAAETPLWSDRLRLAGMVDFVAEAGPDLVIGDFKNSRRGKNRDDILDYWHQVTLYGLMWYERTGVQPRWIDIVIGNRKDLTVEVYREPFTRYLKEVIKRVKDWRLT